MEASTDLRRIIEKVKRRRMLGMQMVMERKDEFPSMAQAQLTGIALDPDARELAEMELNKLFSSRPFYYAPASARELVIGGGPHAAAYTAIRVLAGFDAPVVVERNATLGGAFSIPATKFPGMQNSSPPVFFLNSRNRRGMPGLSGDSEAQLNYLPGAPIQPSAISNAEYQTNADMAFITRLTFAQYNARKTFANCAVQQVEKRDSDFRVTLFASDAGPFERPQTIRVTRIIDARGLGDPKDEEYLNGTTILSFPQFMQRMTKPWPLRGLRNVAVIGVGDSGKCAVEAFLGIAPQSFMSPVELDSVNRVDWYGDIETTYETYCANNRGRYRAIGRYLRPDRTGSRKLFVYRGTVFPEALPNGPVIINGRSYDLVVMATGNRVKAIPGLDAGGSNWFVCNSKGDRSNNNSVARLNYYDDPPFARYRIGPLADIPFTSLEFDAGVANVENNKVAMFRLLPRTAQLAAKLPAAEFPSL